VTRRFPTGAASGSFLAPTHRDIDLPDRPATLPAALSIWCVRAFTPAAIAGALVALSAPVPFVRMLGIVALAGSLLGLLLHIALLRRDYPAAWTALRDRFRARVAALQSRLRHGRIGSAPRATLTAEAAPSSGN